MTENCRGDFFDLHCMSVGTVCHVACLRTLDISYKHFKTLLKTCFDKATALCDILSKRLRILLLTYISLQWRTEAQDRSVSCVYRRDASPTSRRDVVTRLDWSAVTTDTAHGRWTWQVCQRPHAYSLSSSSSSDDCWSGFEGILWL